MYILGQGNCFFSCSTHSRPGDAAPKYPNGVSNQALICLVFLHGANFRQVQKGELIVFCLIFLPVSKLALIYQLLLFYLIHAWKIMDPEFLRPSSRENYWWWWQFSYSLVLPTRPSTACNLTMVLTSLRLVSKLKFLITLKGSKITKQNQEMVIALDPLRKTLKEDKLTCNKSKKWNNNNFESNFTEWYS